MSTPKISLGSWAFSFGPFSDEPWSFPKICAYAAEAGYDGVEINGFNPHPHPDVYNTPEKCSELLKEINDYGLGISGYAPSFEETPPDQGDPAAYLDTFRKCIAFCERMNIETIRVDTISPPDAPEQAEYDKRFKQLTETWRTAAQDAAASGMTVVWEFEPGFWLNKPSEVLAIVEAVNHPGFKLLFDTSHAHMGAVIGARHAGEKETLPGGVAEYGEMAKDHIGHLHLIDSDGTLHDDETSTHTAFGKGDIDFVASLTPIKDVIRTIPWWCVDFCFNPEGPVEGKNAVPFVKNVIKEVL